MWKIRNGFILLCILLSMNGLARAQGTIKVVTSFGILGDMVKNIGGDRVSVISLVGPNGDVHAYSPTPAAARSISGAALVVVNGLGLEGWMDRLIMASGYKGRVAIASTGVKPRKMKDEGGGGRIIIDPHAWQDLDNGLIYVENIKKALIAVDPAGTAEYLFQAAAYAAKLARLNTWVKKEFSEIPDKNRRMITSHDAFGYLGAAYGIEIFSPMGMNTESEPSAGEVKNLIQQIRDNGITAVFVENITDPRLVEQIAREAGVKIGGELYSDALSTPDGPASTYLDMFRNNVTKIVGAMRKR